MRAWIAVWICLAGITLVVSDARAGGDLIELVQTQTTPPPVPIPLPNQQSFTNYNNCVMGCDTRAGLCQGGCTVPVSAATPPAGTRPDVGGLSQCILNCTSQSLTCKQSCTVR